jgi:hypothetical protein
MGYGATDWPTRDPVPGTSAGLGLAALILLQRRSAEVVTTSWRSALWATYVNDRMHGAMQGGLLSGNKPTCSFEQRTQGGCSMKRTLTFGAGVLRSAGSSSSATVSSWQVARIWAESPGPSVPSLIAVATSTLIAAKQDADIPTSVHSSLWRAEISLRAVWVQWGVHPHGWLKRASARLAKACIRTTGRSRCAGGPDERGISRRYVADGPAPRGVRRSTA